MDNLPLAEIAELFGRDQAEIDNFYQTWLANRQKKNRPIVPDIKLLAGLSGLSTASISNFMRQKQGSVSEAKSIQLAKLVDIVGYVPSSAAQNLRKRQRHTIGIALPLSSISPHFYLEILSGIQKEADILGYDQLIFDVNTEIARDEFFDTMPFLGIVDGLIAVGLHIDKSRLTILERQHVPITTIHNRLNHPAVVANIIPISENALQDMVDHHLVKKHGYRRLALVTLGTVNALKMGDSVREDWTRIARIHAYKTALRLNGITPDNSLIFTVNAHSTADGYDAFERIRQHNAMVAPDERIQAVVCTSDTLAAAILMAARRANIELPVTGFDNLPLAELLDITTIEQRAQKVGQLAFRHLYNAIIYQKRTGKFPPPVEEEVDMRMIVRSSCGCT